MGGLTVFQDGVKALVNKGPKKITPFFIPYAITNMGGALLAIEKGFMGPNYSISTACATANYAFAAANHIKKGEADVMIAGGVEAPIIPVGLGGFVACRALSTNNDDPSGASRPGTSRATASSWARAPVAGDGVAGARKRGARIHAEYLGGAITCDAHHMTDPRPDGSGVGLCITKAVEEAASTSPRSTTSAAPHATSTLVGDVAEVNAVKKAFGGVENLEGVKMNGTKSMVGHCLGAAAGVEAVATIMAIKTGWLHPTLNNADPSARWRASTSAPTRRWSTRSPPPSPTRSGSAGTTRAASSRPTSSKKRRGERPSFSFGA